MWGVQPRGKGVPGPDGVLESGVAAGVHDSVRPFRLSAALRPPPKNVRE